MSSFTNGSGSLRPTWSRSSGSQGGRGFQPPPAVPVERRTRSGSQGSSGSNDLPRPTNKFAALDDDEDDVAAAASKPARTPPFRSNSFGAADRKSPAQGPRGGGRSLADLAATVPEASLGRAHPGGFRPAGRSDSFSEVAKVTRFTREKLLALRPRPEDDGGPPEDMKHLGNNPILSAVPLDPDCWDTFDADEIWAQAARERTTTRSSSLLAPKGGPPVKPVVEPIEGRRTSAPGLGKWQRGVALPPPDENARRGKPDAENPNDLWDDPLAATDAASDFSAFGAIPDDPKEPSRNDLGGGDVFDFDKMAEATQMFDDERRGTTKPTITESVEVDEDEEDENHMVPVNPHRPLAGVGTTIRSGSGDDVNVFEDFENPGAAGVKAAGEDPDASSRLMAMIGVTREETTITNPQPTEGDAAGNQNPWAAGEKPDPSKPSDALSGDSIPSNPWGQPIVPPSEPQNQQQGGSGFDLAARLGQAAAEQEEQHRRQSQQEVEMRRRQEEDGQRREMEQRARQQAMQQQGAGHSQVELVLMERISVILENSWGRSDLISILSTLHSEDSRVIPLLGNAEALRSLVARHPRRIALRQDPAFGAEMAVLLLTNAQFQQQEVQARAQQEEMQRRESQLRMEAQRNQNGARNSLPPIVPDAPWFYSDPQSNIQGPFRGEEMRQWLEAGYFKGDLPISQQPSGPFLPLSNIFQDLSFAFRAPPGQSSDANAAAAEDAAREEEQRAKEEQDRRASEEQQQAQAEAMAAAASAAVEAQREAQRESQREAQREREERAATEAKEAAALQVQLQAQQNEQNNSSAQLKMMLGLGQQAESSAVEPPLVDEPEEPKPPKAKKSQKQRNQPAAAPSSPAAPPKPVWGNGVSAQVKRKSMAEIQQEEARAAAVHSMERKASGKTASGGWANVASSKGGGTGWQGGAVKPTAAAVAAGPSNVAQSPRAMPKQPKLPPASRQVSAPAALQPQHRASQQQKAADDFGAAMSSSLESWCKEQMRKLNGSDDLTLVSFCMTLNDPAEIRTYLTAYLGSTPQVNSFATDFINKRGLGKTQQEEWESTKPKKGRKKVGK